MDCPDCKQRVDLRFSDARVIGIACPRCHKRWSSERVTEIFDHCHDQMIRQIKGIVNHMDFDASCVEMTEKADV